MYLTGTKNKSTTILAKPYTYRVFRSSVALEQREQNQLKLEQGLKISNIVKKILFLELLSKQAYTNHTLRKGQNTVRQY